VFNFPFLCTPWRAADLRDSIDSSLAALSAVRAPATWVLSNHDVVRCVSRFGRPPESHGRTLKQLQLTHMQAVPADLDLGARRARAAALLTLALPGSAYIYQGDELGLWEVEDLPDAALQDPQWEQSGYRDRGRDGCRVPMPWSGDAPPFGFGPAGSRPWLPQPDSWKGLTADRQQTDPGSMLRLYRTALRLRREHPALGDGSLRWLDAPAGVLVFARDPDFVCAVNISPEPWPLPEGSKVLLSSGPQLQAKLLPPDSAAWLTTARHDQDHMTSPGSGRAYI
jgi:alpha-glucosidase